MRNTLNHAFDPTAGSFQDVSLEFAGLGGSTSFYRFEGRGRWFFPVYRIPDIGPLVPDWWHDRLRQGRESGLPATRSR